MLTGYKTYIASGIAAVTGVLAMTNWVDFIANPKAGATALGMALLMATMRSITKTPAAGARP